MVIEQQISARRERAHGSIVRILTRPDGNLYGDYSVRSASNKTYRVAMRGPDLFDNYCSCPDFAVNSLGTCKHIEALLARLRRRRGKAVDREVFNRARASLSLHYRDTLNVRLRLPPPEFASGQSSYFIITADFNRDGKPDLATTNLNSGTVSIFLNTSQ